MNNGWFLDGFCFGGDGKNPKPEFQKAVDVAMEKVIHIAPTDDINEITLWSG